jgi:predicted metal-dependent phosphoesterase TrpH
VTGTRVDLHVKTLDERVVGRAKKRGVDVLVYAPHFTRWPDIRDRAAAFSDEDLLVVPGRELFTGDWRTRRHVLALDLEKPIPDFLTLSGTMDELARQTAVVLAPHPGFLTISLGREQVDRYRGLLDGVEVYNPKYLPHNSRRARTLADEVDLPEFASSYAHLRGTVGEAWTVLEREVTSTPDLHAALREGADRTVGRRQGPSHSLRRALEFAHIGWENSWKKLDRLYLSGTEATHPTHVVYGSRFDDVRVY